jgi:prepilin-type N-terminal cleavage/methylation domain-containing protein
MSCSLLQYAPPSGSARSPGFSLIEVLVAAGVLAVLMAALLPNLRRSWENERVLALANEFASWLNQVKTYSMRNDISCQVTITPANNRSGQSLANVTPACAPAALGPNFLIPEMPAGRFVITASANAAPNNPFNYTPRGATTNTAAVTVTFRAGGPAAIRCVQISPILGQARVGIMNGANCQIN